MNSFETKDVKYLRNRCFSEHANISLGVGGESLQLLLQLLHPRVFRSFKVFKHHFKAKTNLLEYFNSNKYFYDKRSFTSCSVPKFPCSPLLSRTVTFIDWIVHRYRNDVIAFFLSVKYPRYLAFVQQIENIQICFFCKPKSLYQV